MTLNGYFRKQMLRGLIAAAATNCTEIADYEDLQAARRILDSHALDCRCQVCMAYVSAASPALGLVAAMATIDKERRANSTRGKSQVSK